MVKMTGFYYGIYPYGKLDWNFRWSFTM